MSEAPLNPYQSPRTTRPPRSHLGRYVRYAMIGLTIFYMLSLVVMVGIMFVAEMRSDKFEELPGGRVLHIPSGKIQPRDEHIASVATTSLWGGLCCTTVPFALLMAGLSGLLLISKKKR